MISRACRIPETSKSALSVGRPEMFENVAKLGVGLIFRLKSQITKLTKDLYF